MASFERLGGNFLGINNDYIFGYVTRTCSITCPDNVFFKLDINSFVYTDLGDRIGVTDEYLNASGFITSFSNNSENIKDTHSNGISQRIVCGE